MARTKIVAGNWKMNKKVFEGTEFIEDIHNYINVDGCEVVICPPTIALTEMSALLEDLESNVMLGAQNVHFEESGAYTGETAAGMLADIGVTHCIIGHSERREYFAETNETVNKKIKKAIEHQIVPIVCVGESLAQREANETFDFIKEQIVKGFEGISAEDMALCVIAYEPIWAIGTGKTATSDQAEEVCKFIRETIKDLYDEQTAEEVRIQYGGSVKAANAKELFSMPNIDGALVGGASLTSEFIDIVKAAL
ncbi:MAG: triose-phosphate isomerase [Clostridia bacterium]|nr:triose-phosphate isomerase [Clostridia bacterium]